MLVAGATELSCAAVDIGEVRDPLDVLTLDFSCENRPPPQQAHQVVGGRQSSRDIDRLLPELLREMLTPTCSWNPGYGRQRLQRLSSVRTHGCVFALMP